MKTTVNKWWFKSTSKNKIFVNWEFVFPKELWKKTLGMTTTSIHPLKRRPSSGRGPRLSHGSRSPRSIPWTERRKSPAAVETPGAAHWFSKRSKGRFFFEAERSQAQWELLRHLWKEGKNHQSYKFIRKNCQNMTRLWLNSKQNYTAFCILAEKSQERTSQTRSRPFGLPDPS